MSMPKITPQRWTMFSLVILLIGVAWVGISRAPTGSTTNGKIPLPRQGFQAPDFSLATTSGETASLAELRGRPVLVNLWTSWCPPCKAEMPALQRVYNDYQGQGLEILAINATYQDNLADAIAFAEQLGLEFPILVDDTGKVSRLYALRSLPTSFFIDREGVIQEVVIGGPMSEALLRIRVEQLLEK